MTTQTYKNLRRLNKIIITLIRYGFGGLVSQMKVLPFFSVLERIFVFKKKEAELSVPVRIRLVLEELGPTFIKLGQIASTRADIFPPSWIEEIKKLQDAVPPFPYEEVKRVVEKSLHAPLEERYRSFDTEPVASASIAQVHLAELPDGTPVAVKVKRPDIDRVIHSDISVMYTIAQLLEKYVPQSRRYRPHEVVDEFARVIKNEQDLTVEGGYVNRFENLFKDNPEIQIPHVYWDLTTEEVLTMERIHGTPIDESEKIRALGLDVKEVANRGLELFFQQVFEHGIFHADLHPGNIFVRDDGVIIYLDFGIVGHLDRNLRKYLASILYYLIKEDYYRMALIHKEMGLIGEDVDVSEFEEALREIAEPIFGRTLEHIHMSALLMKLIETARQFNMTLQPNLLLLQKSMVIIEGVGRQLYPDINMWEVARPLITRWMYREKFSPGAVYQRASLGAEELAGVAYQIPVHANDVLRKTKDGKLRVGLDHHGLGNMGREMENVGRRIGGGVITGSLFISGTVAAVFSEEGATEVLGVPLLSAVLFAAGVVASIRLWGLPHSKKE